MFRDKETGTSDPASLTTNYVFLSFFPPDSAYSVLQLF